MFNTTSTKDAIKEFLIANQASIKEDVMHLGQMKRDWLEKVNSVYKEDLDNQYDARIKQHIAFVCSHALAIPAEYIIIELEKINIEDYLNV